MGRVSTHRGKNDGRKVRMEVEHPTMPPRCMRNQGVTAWPKDIRLPKPEQELRKTEKSVHLTMKETRYTADSTSLTTPQESRVSAQPATRRLRSAYHPHHWEKRRKKSPPPPRPPPKCNRLPQSNHVYLQRKRVQMHAVWVARTVRKPRSWAMKLSGSWARRDLTRAKHSGPLPKVVTRPDRMYTKKNSRS